MGRVLSTILPCEADDQKMTSNLPRAHDGPGEGAELLSDTNFADQTASNMKERIRWT